MECMMGSLGVLPSRIQQLFPVLLYFLWYSVYTYYATLSRGIFNKQNTMVI